MANFAELTHAAARVRITGGAGAISPDNTRTKGCSVAKTGGDGQYTVTLAEYIDQRECAVSCLLDGAAGGAAPLAMKVTSQTDETIVLLAVNPDGVAVTIPDTEGFSFALRRIAVG